MILEATIDTPSSLCREAGLKYSAKALTVLLPILITNASSDIQLMTYCAPVYDC